MGKYLNLTGQRYGSLVAMEYAGNDRLGKAMWHCDCACGERVVVRANSLRSGRTVSCGCRRKAGLEAGRWRHGMYWHSAYKSWESMISRCTNPVDKDYQNYGGRGICVCEAWLDPVAFVQDMGERPEGMTLDRINTNGNYEPENCRWATPMQQGANKRNNVIVSLNGVTAHIAEVSRLTGIPETTVRRISRVIR